MIQYFAEYDYDYNRLDMFERYTESSIRTIMFAQDESRKTLQSHIGTEQILIGICAQEGTAGHRALTRYNINLEDLRGELKQVMGPRNQVLPTELPFTPRAKRIVERAMQESRDIHHVFISSDHMLLAITSDSCCVGAQIIRSHGVSLHKMRYTVLAILNGGDETEEDIKFFRPVSETERLILERDLRGSPTPLLDEFSENLTKTAIAGELDPVVGRDSEIKNVIRCLARRRKNNPVLIGEPGVGKTAVAEGLALMTLTERIPEFLIGASIMALDLGSVLAGTKYRGEFEERIKFIVEEVEEDRTVIVLIDEIHVLVGAGAAEGAVDAANILKPALARGKFKCMGATTISEYRQHIEKDPALERRFIPVMVDEPSVPATIAILLGLKEKFEEHHLVVYETKAIEACVNLSDKYMNDRYLPDKAIDILDDAGAKVKLEFRSVHPDVKKCLKELKLTLQDKQECIRHNYYNAIGDVMLHEIEVRTYLGVIRKAEKENEKFLESKPITANEICEALAEQHGLPVFSGVDRVTEEDVLEVLARRTGIPLNKLSDDEQDKLLYMEDNLHKRLIGQEEAVSAVSKAIRRARVGLRSKDRPIGSFIFAGPTGVGKTELTKAIADYMFGEEDSMVRIDMTEFMEKHTVAKLIGSPPGYIGYGEGGQLTEAVRTTPYAVVLLDEVEKAHSDIFNILLQVLDDGRLTDSKGKEIDFTNTLMIMTTNLGTKAIEKDAEFIREEEEETESKYDYEYWNRDPDEEKPKPKKPTRKIRQVRRMMRRKSEVLRELTSLEKMEVDMGFRTVESIRAADAKEEERKQKVFDQFSFVEDREEELIPEKPEKRDEEVIQRTHDAVMEELKIFFRPEFLNRIDAIIVFQHLTLHDLWEIAGLMIKSVIKRLEESKYYLTVSPGVRSWIVEQGYDPAYGARPLRRAVTSVLEDALTEHCLSNPVYENTKIQVDRKVGWGNEDSEFRDFYLDEIEVKFDHSDVDPRLIAREETRKRNRIEKERLKSLNQSITPEEREKKRREEMIERMEFVYHMDPRNQKIETTNTHFDIMMRKVYEDTKVARLKRYTYENNYLKGIYLTEEDEADMKY